MKHRLTSRAIAALAAALCSLADCGAVAATRASGPVVRERTGSLPDAWLEGRTAARGECTAIALRQKLPSGRDTVLLTSDGELQRQEGGDWVEVPLNAQRSSEPQSCLDAAGQ